MRSLFLNRKKFIGFFLLAAIITLKYQNCAPTDTEGSFGNASTAPYPTLPWNGVTSGTISSVSMNLSGTQPQYLFPQTQFQVTITVQGSSTFNIEGGVYQNGQQAYFSQCAGATSGTGTVTATCTFVPGTTGYTMSVSGFQNLAALTMFVTVVDSSGNVLAQCTSATGVCTGNAYSMSLVTFPIGYQIGSNCYHLNYTGGGFSMAKPSASFVVTNPSAMLTGFSNCVGSNCCDNSGNCFNTAGGYNGSTPNTCL